MKRFIVSTLVIISSVISISCKKTPSMSYEEQKTLLSSTRINTEIKALEEKLGSASDIKEKGKLLAEISSLQLEKGDVHAAMKSSEKALKHSKDGFMALYVHGKSCRMSGDYARSIKQLSRSIKKNESFAPAHFELGNVYYRKGEYHAARKKYEKAHALDENNIDTMNNLAVICARSGDVKRARILLEKVISIEENNATAHRNLGLLYEKHIKDTKRAVDHYSRYLEILPAAPDRKLVELWINSIRGNNK